MIVATPWNQQPKPPLKIGPKKHQKETKTKRIPSIHFQVLASCWFLGRVGVFFQNLNFVWAELAADSISTTRHPPKRRLECLPPFGGLKNSTCTSIFFLDFCRGKSGRIPNFCEEGKSTPKSFGKWYPFQFGDIYSFKRRYSNFCKV